MVNNRTMKAAKAAKSNFAGEEIVKPGELVDIRFLRNVSPGLAAKRTLALLIGVAAGDAWKDKTHRITKKELRQGHKANDRIADLLDEVSGIRLKIETISSRGRHAIMRAGLFKRLVEETDDGDDAWVEWEFSEATRDLFGASEHYAALNRAALFAFKSKYSVTLYELGCLHTSRRHPVWSGDIQALRELLGLPEGKMVRWPDFKRYTLGAAKAEIDQIAHFTLTWKEKRQGRKVMAVELYFWRKDPADMDTSADEVDRHKTGRKQRREGSVETLLPPTANLDDEIIY